jgi:death-on-curing protein
VIEYLDLDDLSWLIESQHGTTDIVRDWGLLESALHRPRASVFGEDAYQDLHIKAAALLDSIVRNHPLVDGNKRLGIRAVALFYGYNGIRLSIADAADGDDFIRAVARGEILLEKTAEWLRGWTAEN